MFEIFRQWSQRFFAREEAVILVLMVVVSIGLLMAIGHVLAPVITSLILAFMMQGMIARLRHWGVSQWLAVSVAFVVFAGSFFAFVFVVFPLAWRQCLRLFNELPAMLESGQQLLLDVAAKFPMFISAQQVADLMVFTTGEMGDAGQWVLSFSLSSFPLLVGLMVYLVLVPMLVFFLLKDRTLLLSWFASFLPDERPMLNRIWVDMTAQMANYVRGKAIEILIVGAACYIGFMLLGLSYAALLSLLVGLSVVIPYVGAVVVTVPVIMVAYFQWGWSADFFTLLMVYGIIQTLDGVVLVPLLFSEAVNLHPVAIILAILVFGAFWGLWGVFFAIPLATLLKAIIDAWPRVTNTAVNPPRV